MAHKPTKTHTAAPEPTKPKQAMTDSPYVETGTEPTPVPAEPDETIRPGEEWGDWQARVARQRERELAAGKKLPPSSGLTSPSDCDESGAANPQTVDR